VKTLSLLAAILVGLALSWTVAAQTALPKEFLPPLPAGKEWKLIRQDEFDGTKLDETKWNRLGDHVHKGGWWLKEDAYLSGQGTLLLRTKMDGDRFTCGALDTRGKFEYAFGYYVARLKMPKQPGHWPAFWLQTRKMTTVGDEGRDGTEIDIVELPWRDGRITMNLHWDGPGRSGTDRSTRNDSWVASEVDCQEIRRFKATKLRWPCSDRPEPRGFGAPVSSGESQLG
jgi:beta-glucanase (GH16 family)